MSSFSLTDNFASLFQTDVAKYVGTAWFLSILGLFTVNTVVSKLLGAEDVLKKAPFRDFKAIQMLYYPLVSCIVQPLLTVLLAFTLFGESTVRAWDSTVAVSFATTVWFATSFHGIWLDYTTFQVPFTVAILFWCGSLTHAIITGYFMGYVL